MKKPSTWAHYKALLRKDLAQELHTKEMITSMGLYALLVLVVYGAVDDDGHAVFVAFFARSVCS